MMKARILIVEDEKIVARDIEKTIEKMGYSAVGTVSSGEEAIECSEKLCPDMILMDIVLKTEMDGITAAEQIMQRFNIPVVYLTACDDEMILQQARIATHYEYIIKPFDYKELRAAIELALYKNHTQSRIKKIEKWLASIMNDVDDSVICYDSEGCITFMNEVAENLTGWKKDEAIGKTLEEVVNVKDDELNDFDRQWLSQLIRRSLIRPLPT